MCMLSFKKESKNKTKTGFKHFIEVFTLYKLNVHCLIITENKKSNYTQEMHIISESEIFLSWCQ